MIFGQIDTLAKEMVEVAVISGGDVFFTAMAKYYEQKKNAKICDYS